MMPIHKDFLKKRKLNCFVFTIIYENSNRIAEMI